MLVITDKTESYPHQFSRFIKISQIIEKHSLPTVISHRRKISNTSQDADSMYFNVDEASKNGMFVIKLPTDKTILTDPEKYENSPLKEILKIKEIAEKKSTKITVVERSGNNFKIEIYRIRPGIHGSEIYKTIEYTNEDQSYMSSIRNDFKKNFVFEEDEPQTYISFELNPPQIFANGTGFSLNGERVPELQFFDRIAFSNLGRAMRDFDAFNYNATIFYRASLITLNEINKIKSLGLKGSFLDLIYLKEERGADPRMDLKMHGKPNLIGSAFDIWVRDFSGVTGEKVFFDERNNEINPLAPATFSIFLFPQKNNLTQYTAHDFISDVYKHTDIKYLRNNITTDIGFNQTPRIVFGRTALFVSDRNPSEFEELRFDYDQWFQEYTGNLKNKWDKIEKRVGKYRQLGFVPKIICALRFIRKYMICDYYGSTIYRSWEQNPDIKTPEIIDYFEENYKIKFDEFFNMSGIRDYFKSFDKLKPSERFYIFAPPQHEKIHTETGNLITWARRLSLPDIKVCNVAPKNRMRYYNENDQTAIIINDSYTKQAWRPKVKEMILRKVGGIPHHRVTVITVANKLEAVILGRILKDRPDVYFYSKLLPLLQSAPKSKAKTKKSNARNIKFFEINTISNAAVKTDRFWDITDDLQLLVNPNTFIIKLKKKKHFEFNNTEYTVNYNEQGLVFWSKILKKDNMTILFVNERDFAYLKKNESELQTFEDYFNTPEFQVRKQEIANNKLYVDGSIDYNVFHRFLQLFFQLFFRGNYAESSKKIRNDAMSDMFWNYVEYIKGDFPHAVSALEKIMMFFKLEERQYDLTYNFTRQHLHVIKDGTPQFDDTIFKEILVDSYTYFTKEEIDSLSNLNDKYKNGLRSQHTNLITTNHLEHMNELLLNSNYKNIDKTEMKELLEAKRLLHSFDLFAVLLK
jgi:hypothetical protein